MEPFLEQSHHRMLFTSMVIVNGDLLSVRILYESFYFSKASRRITISKLSMDPKKPIITLNLAQNVPKDSTGVLKFSFKGNMETGSTEAFFKSTYTTEQEVERFVNLKFSFKPKKDTSFILIK